MERDGWAGQIHQTEWAQSNPEGLACDLVYLSCSCDAFFLEPSRFVDPRNEEPVDAEARAILAENDHLAHCLAVLLDCIQCLLRCRLSGN